MLFKLCWSKMENLLLIGALIGAVPGVIARLIDRAVGAPVLLIIGAVFGAIALSSLFYIRQPGGAAVGLFVFLPMLPGFLISYGVTAAFSLPPKRAEAKEPPSGPATADGGVAAKPTTPHQQPH
jgi:hypothetical protein